MSFIINVCISGCCCCSSWRMGILLVYTICEYFGFLEIPYILTWALNDKYTSYKASMQPNTACSSSRYASQVQRGAEISGTTFSYMQATCIVGQVWWNVICIMLEQVWQNVSTMHMYVNKTTCPGWGGWQMGEAEPETIYH